MSVYANAIPPQKSFLNRPQRIGREQPTMLGFDGLLTPVCRRYRIEDERPMPVNGLSPLSQWK